MSGPRETNPDALPLKGSVLQLSEPRDGKHRVTFKELASIYYVDDTHPERDRILVALQRSLDTGEVLRLTYSIRDKCLTGFDEG
ncbi:MAG: hypothetical protein ABIJ09_09515 [Pseudomonadota bacterium]